MAIRGTTVAVVGGSIAGCAAALALGRAGCDVSVFERSAHLEDRGSGIAIPLALRDELIESGYLDAGYATWPMAHRRWVIRDDDQPMGRLLWKQQSEAVTNNWGNLWRSLRAQVPDEIYHEGMGIVSLDLRDDGVDVTFADGSERRYDAVVGADGYRSMVRGMLHPGSAPRFAGYVLWRGNYEEARVSETGPLRDADRDHSWFTVCFPGGHGVFYMIPGFDNHAEVGNRRVNWAIYAPTPSGRGFTEPNSIPPGSIDDDLYTQLDELLTRHFPPYFAGLVRKSEQEEVSLQPIYDEPIPAYVRRRVLLIGDAGTVTRPHTGSGATKALQDALALEALGDSAQSWDVLAAAYDEQRVAEGNKLVELGRRIGAAQVEKTPDWGSMSPDDFERWTKATLAGDSLYFWGDGEEVDALVTNH